MSRRGSNIYKRADGRYEGRIKIGYDENRKLRYKYVYGRTLAEVKEKMEQSYSLKRTETKPFIKLTVKEVCSEWLESKRLTVKKSTYANYSRLLKNHIYPLLGGQAYSLLSKKQLNSFISELISGGRKDGKGGLSSKTVKDIFIVLKSVAVYAHREYGFENICADVKSPKVRNTELKVLSENEIRKLNLYIRHNLDRVNLCILICLYTGIRIGEMCGLKWENVNLQEGFIVINKTVQRISMGKGTSEIVVDVPKTESSVRTVFMPEFLTGILEDFKRSPSIYVLSGLNVPKEPRILQYRFKKVLKDCGIRDVPFHSLRHTYASLCIKKGFDAKALSELLGHSTVNLTLDRYVHTSDEIKKSYVSGLLLT